MKNTFKIGELKKLWVKNVTFLNNEQITYAPISSIFFDPNCSNGTLNDTINFLYIPLVVSIVKLIAYNYFNFSNIFT